MRARRKIVVLAAAIAVAAMSFETFITEYPSWLAFVFASWKQAPLRRLVIGCRRRRVSFGRQHTRLLQVDRHGADFPAEGERLAVEIVERDRRSEVDANVKRFTR